jgi:hypothetical protein
MLRNHAHDSGFCAVGRGIRGNVQQHINVQRTNRISAVSIYEVRSVMHCLDGWVYLCRNFVWFRKTFSPVVDEITHRSFVWGSRQIRFVHVCTWACTEFDLACLQRGMAMHNFVHISAR